MKAMILAAGRGERMRPLTDSTPKPLLRAGGRALIDYHLAALSQSGVQEVVVNMAWQKQQIAEHLGDGSQFGLRILLSDEGDAALETGGGVFHALSALGPEPFWLVNGDVYLEFSFKPPLISDETLAHLLLVDNPEHNPGGDFTLGNEPSSRRVSNEGPEMLTYSGVAVLRPELFASCRDEKFPLAPLLRAAADRGQVTGERLKGYWCDVGTPGRLKELDARLRGQ